MGRHSAQSSRRRARHLKRTARNSLYVLTATSVVTLMVFAGITTYAAAKSNEVPPPDPAYFSQPSYSSSAPQDAYATDAYSEPAPQYGGTLRRCPATGCTASTCHAETGEPPPRW